MADNELSGRVIVTYGRSLIALMIARSLGARGIEIIGCDDVGMTVLSFSRYVEETHIYTSPDKDEERFIEDLVRIVRENRPDDDRPYVLIPGFYEAKLIARHRSRFEDLITVACPDYESIDSVDPKDHLARTAIDLNLEIPRTWLPKNEQDLRDAESEMNFPLFIKPPDDVGGRGVSRVDDMDELVEAFRHLQKRYRGKQLLVQQKATGVDYCYCGLFNRGELVASMVYRNLQKFPNEAGPGVLRETVDSSLFDEIAGRLMKPLKWHGVAEIDFMWDGEAETKPLMIEVNPRFWAGLDHSIQSDIDFPWLLFRMFTTGDAGPVPKARVGKKTSLPGLSTLARLESLFSSSIQFDDLEKSWPKIVGSFKQHHMRDALDVFADAVKDSFSIDRGISRFQKMAEEMEGAENVLYSQDDPMVGLGVLFIFASLIRHGKLPPEITR